MNNKEYFLNVAQTVASKSKDPSSKVGAVIVDEENRIVSCGYNGFVQGCDERKMTWDRPSKYLLVIHAEMNAILFARRNLSNCKIFITHGPCENCLKHLLQAGIREIYYTDCSVMRDRGTIDQKIAIKSLISSTSAKVESATGNSYVDELYFRGEEL